MGAHKGRPYGVSHHWLTRREQAIARRRPQPAAQVNALPGGWMA